MSILGNLMVKHPIFGQPLMENNHPINDQSSVANQVLQIIQPIIDGNWIPRPVKLARQPGRVVDCIFRSSWPTGGMVSQAGDDERTELKCEYGNNEPQRNELPKIL
ncbi:hypothetical protein T01_5370 [Trichinella spiralis]|uniref:Uncharacterized protein n=1 Tax=Trichinella spiralis TaxID=6334 RepID=A0A0V1AYE1_TRISP|nr:hypothetical protein T01_5370 [Trichinella spiralis]